MPDLNDKELDTLLSALSPPEPPNHMSQRIMSALTAPQAAQNKGGIFASLFGARGIALPAGGALASLLFGLTLAPRHCLKRTNTSKPSPIVIGTTASRIYYHDKTGLNTSDHLFGS